MKVKFSYPERTISVAYAVTEELDGRGWETGQVEAAVSGMDKLGKAFGELIEILAEKHLLTKSEVSKFVRFYSEIIDE